MPPEQLQHCLPQLMLTMALRSNLATRQIETSPGLGDGRGAGVLQRRQPDAQVRRQHRGVGGAAELRRQRFDDARGAGRLHVAERRRHLHPRVGRRARAQGARGPDAAQAAADAARSRGP